MFVNHFCLYELGIEFLPQQPGLNESLLQRAVD